MNNILLSISAAAIATAVFRMMSPQDKFEKQIKLIISCFFIVVVLNAFSNNFNLSKLNEIINYESYYMDYEDVFKRQAADLTVENIKFSLYEQLENNGIKPEKIHVGINISENNCISISKIKLVFADISSYEAERAVNIAEEFCGYEITVELEEQ